MSKLATLKLKGDLEQGVQADLKIVTLQPSRGTASQVFEAEHPVSGSEISGALPPNTFLVETIEQWQSNYRHLGATRMQVNQITYDASIHQRRVACQKLDRDLRSQLNDWLLSESFRPIRDKWLEQLMQDEVRVLIRTSSQSLLKLPWQLWDLIERNPLAEVALGTPDAEPTLKAKTPTLRGNVRVLAILGDRTGINIEEDRQLLEGLAGAEIKFLDERERREINKHLWEQDWDILYFAGHSRTEGEQGRIYINKTESLTVEDLRYALKNSVDKGLQLAIFNSCDGMGLAFELQQLNLPQVIVMREPVPDEIAQEFLRYFLPAFTSGQSLYLAEREARLRLHGREGEFPGASWLPVIFQSPANTPPTWLELGRRPTTLCPYRGLFAFREEDAPFFYGRENFTQTLIEAIQRCELVSVIGASGSGKSSVVFAGLVTKLRQQGSWKIVAFRPGQRPFQAIATSWVMLRASDQSQAEQLQSVLQLAEAWRTDEAALYTAMEEVVWESPGTRVLLVVDQFEELYTQCQDAQERQAFIACLLKVVELTNVALVLTLRADFLGQALAYPPLANVLQHGNRMLGAMSRAELEAAINQPATLLGVTLEEGLTDRMIEAVSLSEGNLPLLEFALQELWEKRQGIQLTHAAYDEIGGLEAAVARHAEQAYGKLTELEKERSRQIFLQLVRPGEETVDTRRVATRAEIGDHNWELVTRLASDRLVMTGQDAIAKTETVELVHEALMREWKDLQSWIKENRDFRLWQERLRAAMQQWSVSGRDEGALLRGKSLVGAEDWLRKRPEELMAEREYIEASMQLQQRRRRKKNLGLSGVLAGTFLLGTFAGVAWWNNSTAKTNARLRELAAASDALFKVYQQKKDDGRYNGQLGHKQKPDEYKQALNDQYQDTLAAALKVGRELQKTIYSIDLTTRFQVLTALNQAVYQGTFGTEIKLPECDPRSRSLSIGTSTDSKMIACVNSDGTTRLFDSSSGKKLHVFRGEANWVNDVRFSPDGKMIASGTVEGDVNLWDRSTNKVAKTLKGHLSEVGVLNFSPNGQTVAAGNFDGTITLWDISTGQELKSLKGHSGMLQVQFSPDGQKIASVSADGRVKLWEFQTDQAPKTLPCEADYPTQICQTSLRDIDVAFSSDNRTITYPGNRTLTVWDINANREVKTIEARSIVGAFSSDGKIVASPVNKGEDSTAIVLQDTSTGNIFKTLNTKTGQFSPHALKKKKLFGGFSNISHISFSLHEKLIAAASDDHRMTVWNYQTGKKIKTFEGLTDWTGSISFSPNRKLIVTTGMDANNRESAVKLWDISTGKLLKTLIQEPVPTWRGISRDVRFSSDSQTVAVVSSDSTVRLWDISIGKELNISGLTNSTEPDHARIPTVKGKILAAKMPDGRIKRWDHSTGKELELLYWQKVLSSSFAFGEDNKTIAVVNWNGIKKVRDVATGRELNSTKLDFPFASSINFTDDGSRMAAATPKGVKVWNALTGKEISLLKEVNQKSEDLWVIENLFFSPDGKTLVTLDNVETIVKGDGGKKTSEWSKLVKLWDVQTGKGIETFQSQLSSANDVAFSPDNRMIAFAKTDGSIELRDFLTGKAITALKRHLKGVDRIAFSPDGKILISGTNIGVMDVELKLWDVTASQEIKTYKSALGWQVPANASFWFNRDGKTISLFSYDKITLLNLDLADLLKHGCDKVRDYQKAKNICNKNL